MTDMESLLGDETPTGGSRRAERPRRRGPGCLIALVILAVLAGVAYWGVSTGIEKIQDQFSSADDYSGTGNGEAVSFEVKQGDSIADMGRGLKAAGVVASVEAFIDAAGANPKANRIQAGFYALEKEMKASAVVDVLIDPANIDTTTVAIPEGFTVKQIVARLAKQTSFKKAEFEAALKDPKALGLPAAAEGNAEGYLFPATYSFGPNKKPADMLHDMVARWQQSANDDGLDAAAEALGYSTHDIMTIASLIEAEGRGEYRTKIARVIYNRLENPDNGLTNGLLEIDATVNYALGRDDIGLGLTSEDLEVDSPYNTRKYPGLPPGPIDSPGDDAIQAALHPADGPWLWYVTVNLKTGETKFTDDYDTFQEYKQEYLQYCETSEAC
ncbi:endolytic transglycosylase MltG [Nocardioides halotolerans]|uniref:endolytic transglycosylase MltG n=1 Tax=Nocardioides halotolerans TaxID=433660 RepID=UPI00042273B2|nr:endolytic transglycosylase MltG [Nocardioides halotolerans]